MDETGVRALLERVATDPAPPSRVDIAAARHRGRRRIRWHRAALGAAPLAAAAAVALVVVGVIPASLGLGRGGGLHPGPVAPRSRFSPLQPYAAFGWLPGRLLGHRRHRDGRHRSGDHPECHPGRGRPGQQPAAHAHGERCRRLPDHRPAAESGAGGRASAQFHDGDVSARAELRRWRRSPVGDAAMPGRPPMSAAAARSICPAGAWPGSTRRTAGRSSRPRRSASAGRTPRGARTKPPRAGTTARPTRASPRRSSPPPPGRCSGRSPSGSATAPPPAWSSHSSWVDCPPGWTVTSASFVPAQGRLLGTGGSDGAPAGTRGRCTSGIGPGLARRAIAGSTVARGSSSGCTGPRPRCT